MSNSILIKSFLPFSTIKNILIHNKLILPVISHILIEECVQSLLIGQLFIKVTTITHINVSHKFVHTTKVYKIKNVTS